MSESGNAVAWALLCRLFGRDGTTLESTLSDAERRGLSALADLKAVKQGKLDLSFALCPYCQLLRGRVVGERTGLICVCPDCGPVALEGLDKRAWGLDAEWLIRKLRAAFDVPAQQGFVSISSGIWRVGARQGRSLILARSIDHVLQAPSSLSRAETRSADLPWLVTPKPLRDIDNEPVHGRAVWLPLEERFSLYGGNVHFIEPGKVILSDDNDPLQATYGPFSADFRWVHLAGWKHGPIALSEAQAAVFKALWQYKGLPQQSEPIMNKAGLESAKPIDVFKVKTQNKGDSRYEGPLHAYKTLVITDRRAGTYVLPCAGSTPT